MKKIAILIFSLAIGTYVGAQTLDTVVLVSKAKKFTPGENILLMFELLDTVDVYGKSVTMSRSYYFDEKNRTISSVREYYDPKKPESGTQVVYSFSANKLTAVSIIPPKSTCRNCASQYNYSNDSLLSKQIHGSLNVDPTSFVNQARYFQSKVPNDLPWGFFDDEVIINGKKKKIKKNY
jgi:hypothetical protein